MSSEVLVGDKELGRYYQAVDTQLDENEEVKILSRGQLNNGKALDVAEIVRREEGAEVVEMSTRTETFDNDDGEEVRVTELEVKIEKREEEEEEE